jgi:hypothetical protein
VREGRFKSLFGVRFEQLAGSLYDMEVPTAFTCSRKSICVPRRELRADACLRSQIRQQSRRYLQKYLILLPERHHWLCWYVLISIWRNARLRYYPTRLNHSWDNFFSGCWLCICRVASHSKVSEYRGRGAWGHRSKVLKLLAFLSHSSCTSLNPVSFVISQFPP